MLLGGWQVPPAAAATMVENVQVAWTDSTHTKIRITWTETSPVANTLRLETRIFDDSPPSDELALGSTTAAGPNQVIINTSYLGYSTGYDLSRIIVTDPGGGEARSVPFDRFLHSVESRLSVTPEGTMRWTAPPFLRADSTPDDPFDLEGTTRYAPRLYLDKEPHTTGGCGVIDLPTTPEGSGALPDEGQPMTLSVATSNEWNPRGRARGIDTSEITYTTLTLNTPASTPYGAPLTLTGVAIHHWVNALSLADCRPETRGVAWLEGDLEGRDSSTGPWYHIGYVEAAYVSGRYVVNLTNRGAREYRLKRRGYADFHEIRNGAITPIKQVRTSTRVVSAKFIAPVINYGTKPQAYLWVDPAGSQRAALQFKNASGAWQGLTYKTLYAGRGLVTFPWSRRGVTQFRWWVPGSSTSTGLKVDPVYSAPFSLTVR